MKKIILPLLLITIICLSSCSSKLVFYDQDYDVKVYGDYFEPGTVFNIQYYPYESHAMEEIMEVLLEKGIQLGSKGDFYIYDISTTLNGINVDPKESVEIRIPKPSDMNNIDEFALYHIHGDDVINIDFNLKGKYLCFKTDSFSYFVFVKKNIGEQFYIAVHAEGPGKVVTEDNKEVDFVNLELGEKITFIAKEEKGHTFKGWYYSDDFENVISKDKKYTYERTNLIDEGFFIYAIFE